MAMHEADRAVRAIPGRLHDFRGTGRGARVRRAVHRRPHRTAVARAHVRQVGRRIGFRGADVRGVLAAGAVAAAHRERADAAGRLPGRSENPPAGHSERTHRDLLGRHRRVRLRRLCGSPEVVRAVRMARRPAGGAAIRCTCSRTSRRRGCTASWISVQSARVRKCKGASRSGCIRSTPRLAASLTATWCGYSTTAARAWPAWWSTIACAAMWCNCRPAPGSIRPTPPIRTRCACTAIPNVLTDDAGTSSLARGCTGAHVLVQVEKFTGPLPPVRAHEPPVIADR